MVINNYNYARFLRQAIDSALEQTYPVEVVVVDDGSTDDSVEAIASYGDKIRAVLKSNGGQGSAFNAGFAAARGDILVLLDSDDYLRPNAVERVLAAWQDRNRDLLSSPAGGRCDRPGDRSSTRPRAIRWKRETRCPPSYNTAAFAIRQHQARSTAGACPSQILPMPETECRLCSDTYLAIAAAFRAPIAVTNERLACYRVHDANTFGLPMTRESFTRAKVETHTRFEEQRHALIRRLAAERGLPAPTLPTASIRFAKLQLWRSGSDGDSSGKGIALYVALLRALWTERGTWRFALQKTVMGLLLVVGIEALLRKIYPRFCQ